MRLLPSQDRGLSVGGGYVTGTTRTGPWRGFRAPKLTPVPPVGLVAGRPVHLQPDHDDIPEQGRGRDPRALSRQLDATLLEALCDPIYKGLQIWLDPLTYVREPKLTPKELADWQAGAAWYWQNV